MRAFNQPAVSSPRSNGKLLEMQIFELQPRSTESELLKMVPSSLFLQELWAILMTWSVRVCRSRNTWQCPETFLFVTVPEGLLLAFSRKRPAMLLTITTTHRTTTKNNYQRVIIQPKILALLRMRSLAFDK